MDGEHSQTTRKPESQMFWSWQDEAVQEVPGNTGLGSTGGENESSHRIPVLLCFFWMCE